MVQSISKGPAYDPIRHPIINLIDSNYGILGNAKALNHKEIGGFPGLVGWKGRMK